MTEGQHQSESVPTLLLSLPSALRNRLCIEFASLKHACPKGIYLLPSHNDLAQWSGVLLVRKGPYSSAILHFSITFPEDYPVRPPKVTLKSDVFHPLITPLSTYTHTTTDASSETISAGDEDRLPPGSLTLRHAVPEWFAVDSTSKPPHIIEILQYMRAIFESEALLDSIPLEIAANTGAWHAWHSYRAKYSLPLSARSTGLDSDVSGTCTPPSRHQPGGARGPAEWNWTGVWEDRVSKSVQSSISEAALHGGFF